MTLQQIDQRLSLYPEYLNYFIDRRILNIKMMETVLSYYKKAGFLLLSKIEPPDTFDEWLFKNDYFALSNIHLPYMTFEECKIYAATCC